MKGTFVFNKIIVWTLFAFVSACASVKQDDLVVKTGGAFDLSPYETFRVDSVEGINEKVDLIFDGILAEKLIEKGLAFDASNPDLILQYTLATAEKQRLEITPSTVQSGVGDRLEYIAKFFGGIRVDLIEADTKRLLWNGAAARDVTNDGEEINTNRISNHLDIILSPLVAKHAE
jgi:hypothetical protein